LLLGRQLSALLSPEETPSMTTFASIGQETLAALTKSNRIFALTTPSSGASADELAPIATPDNLALLSACTSEAELVKVITPLLRIARFGKTRTDDGDPCRPVLVNSERHKWLDALHKPLAPALLKKPDLFVTAEMFWSGYRCPSGDPYGKLASRDLQLDGAVREFYEGRVGVGNLTPADFGQLVDYHSRVRGEVRGMLFNACHFWLYESVRDKPVQIIQGTLAAAGSQSALRRFFNGQFQAPIINVLRLLMLRLRVVLVRLNDHGDDADVTGAAAYAAAAAAHADEGAAAAAEVDAATARKASMGQSFLGAGAAGRTFTVRLIDDISVRVLKVVVASTTATRMALESEFNLMLQAGAAGAPVASVVPGSLNSFVSDESGQYIGGGYLLADVLERVSINHSNCKHAFLALMALHDAGFVHGDARLPNLMKRKGGGLVWIDFQDAFSSRGGSAISLASVRRDARTLAASFLGVPQALASDDDVPDLPRDVAIAVAHLTRDAASYEALASAVRLLLINDAELIPAF
jgi:hypothetical protein